MANKLSAQFPAEARPGHRSANVPTTSPADEMLTKQEPVCLTRKEVAESLRVSVRTVDRMIASGQLPVRRVLGGVRFLRSDLEDYLSGVRSAECGVRSGERQRNAES